MLSLAFVLQAVLIGVFDIDTRQRSLEEIAPIALAQVEMDVSNDAAAQGDAVIQRH